MQKPSRRALADRYANDEIFDRLPHGWETAAYRIPPVPASRVLVHGDVIDLGNRAFEVIHTPGHSPGGIALHELATGILLSGDIIYDGPLLTDTYHSDLADYASSMEKLRAVKVSVVHGGHFPSFGATRFRQLIDEYLAGQRLPGCHLNI